MRVAANEVHIDRLMQGRDDEGHTHVIDAGFGDSAILDVCGEVPSEVAAGVPRVEQDAAWKY